MKLFEFLGITFIGGFFFYMLLRIKRVYLLIKEIEEVKNEELAERDKYIKKVDRIETDFFNAKTSSIDSAFASHVLSGKVQINESAKTSSTDTKRD